MDNSADWIYIVIGLIAAVSSIFSSKKKKKAQNLPKTTRAKGSPFTDFNNIETLQEKKRPMTFLELRELKGDLPDEKRDRVFIPTEPDTNVSPNAEYAFNNMDELKKAIVYNEILNRKY